MRGTRASFPKRIERLNIVQLLILVPLGIDMGELEIVGQNGKGPPEPNSGFGWFRSVFPAQQDLDFLANDPSIPSNLEMDLDFGITDQALLDGNSNNRPVEYFPAEAPCLNSSGEGVMRISEPGTRPASVKSTWSHVTGNIPGIGLADSPLDIRRRNSATDILHDSFLPLPESENFAVAWSLIQDNDASERSEDIESLQGIRLGRGLIRSTGGHSTTELPLQQLKPPPSEKDTTFWVQKLSDINVRLYQHIATIPPLEDSSQTNGAHSPESSVGPGSRTESSNIKVFAIDETFRLSQLFIEVLNQLYPLYSMPSCRSHKPSPSISRQKLLTPLSSKSSTSSALLDQGSELLVLSSYWRFIEAYEKIFQHMNACVVKRRASNHEVQLRLPSLAIGSFSLPSSSATQITLVIHLIETMMARIRDLVNEMTVARLDCEEASGSEAGGSGAVTEATQQAIRVKEAATMKLVNNIKKVLLQSSIL